MGRASALSRYSNEAGSALLKERRPTLEGVTAVAVQSAGKVLFVEVVVEGQVGTTVKQRFCQSEAVRGSGGELARDLKGLRQRLSRVGEMRNEAERVCFFGCQLLAE